MKRTSFLSGTVVPSALLVVTALAHGQDMKAGSTGETILTGGQAAVVTSDAVKVVSIGQTPPQLQAALNADWTKH